MEPVELTSYVLHTVFAGLWMGGVAFFAWAVLPLARAGDLQPPTLAAALGKLTRLTRVSALVLFATGSHMAAARYTRESLLGTDGGYLVLSMLALWLVLTALLEIGGTTLRRGLAANKIREPAHAVRRHFQVCTLLAILLLVNAGLLAAHNVGFL